MSKTETEIRNELIVHSQMLAEALRSTLDELLAIVREARNTYQQHADYMLDLTRQLGETNESPGNENTERSS